MGQEAAWGIWGLVMAKVSVSKSRLWKAIRLKCVDCCGGNRAEVRQCLLEECSLFPYRFGSRGSLQDAQEGRESALVGGVFGEKTVG